MASQVSGISGYQKMNQLWQTNSASKAGKSASANEMEPKDSQGVKVSEWKPLSEKSPLIPTAKEGYGTVIGDVNLSDKAKDYYNTLKSKFHGMDFILVSKDMKSQVAANAAAYGNASKPVVLIDDEKLEKMATDENFRKKYEGIISMSQSKLAEAKNSLVSSGANVKNFGISVGEDGRASFFASVEKASDAQTKALEKRQAKKKAEKIKAKKQAQKEAQAKKLEEKRNEKTEDKLKDKLKEKKLQDKKAEEKEIEALEEDTEKEYVVFQSDSLEGLLTKVAGYAQNVSMGSVMTEAESKVGQTIDFKG